MIGIINYNMGNLRSVEKAFQRIGVEAVVTGDVAVLDRADKVVLPGVGHFGRGMAELSRLGLLDWLQAAVCDGGKPLLGICLGMQLLTQHSEEGDAQGLGWIDAKTVRFPETKSAFRVPHIGWNTLKATPGSFLDDVSLGAESYYFVHSYYVVCDDESTVASRTDYGLTFTSAVQKGHIFGTQFHPEKSHGPGLAMLKKFATKS